MLVLKKEQMPRRRLTAKKVYDFVDANEDRRLWTFDAERPFRISRSQAGGIRFDRHTGGYETIKPAEVGTCVHPFNSLTDDERRRPSSYQIRAFVTSYMAPLLLAAFDGAELEKTDETQGHGYGLSSEMREALADYGMERATAYYRNLGWNVQPRGKPYDLLCTRSPDKSLLVEVKASTGPAESIIITEGEYTLARSKRVALFILQNVVFQNGKPTGGKTRVDDPWRLDPKRAKPTHYRYRID